MKTVALLFGGTSSEHDISCLSARSILREADPQHITITPIGITKKNTWLELSTKDIPKDWEKVGKPIENIIERLKTFDTVFPILHGKNGEDGILQGFLELFGIPFVGCHTLASALGMDKEQSKILFSGVGIPQVPYFSIHYPAYKAKDIESVLPYPVIIKPCNGGSSIGISKASNRKELIKGIKEASNYDRKILIEQFIRGRELECAILENGKLIISDVGEIKAVHEFYDFDAKYESSVEQTIIPAEIPKAVKEQIRCYAKKAFQSLNASGLARIDFFYDEQNKQLYLNEVNTLPGFTNISMYPKLLIHTGISYSKLINALVDQSLREFNK